MIACMQISHGSRFLHARARRQTMGFGRKNRGGGAPPARPMSSMARPAPPAPRPAAPMPPPQPRPAAAPPPAQSQGPGLMGTMASSMAGSMAGNMLANSLMGGRGGEAPAAAPEIAAPPVGPACQFESRQFLECMTNTWDNLDQCKPFFDAFKQCNAQVQA